MIGRLLVAALIVALPRASSAQTVTIDLMTGSAYNAPTPLTIHQNGFPDIRLTAHYDTKPFGPFAPYYSWRVNIWNDANTGAWELQQVHHRLFLTNTTADVELFEIHYGYNFFLVGRAWRWHGFVLHASGGIIVPNPANRIRGQSLNASGPNTVDVGYRIGGAGGQIAVSRQAALTTHLHLIADAAVLIGRATVPVIDGKASVPNVGFHGRLGFGFSF